MPEGVSTLSAGVDSIFRVPGRLINPGARAPDVAESRRV